MDRTSRIVAITLVCIIFMGASSEASSYRNIFSCTYTDYDGAGSSRVFEDAFITNLRQSVSLLVKAYRDERSTWNNTILTVGPVIVIDHHHYVEFTYGYGFDSDNRKTHHIAFEANREMPGYLLNIGVRHSIYPNYSFTVASTGLRYNLNQRISLWGKIFASLDSDNNFDQAYWIEGSYSFFRNYTLSLGTTGGNRLYSPEYETIYGGKADMSFRSILGRLGYEITERLSVRYQFETITRQSKYNDRKNIIIIDAHF